MKAPDTNSYFRLNKFSGNLKIRKEYGENECRYVLTLGKSKPFHMSQDDLNRLGEYIKCNAK